MSATIHRARLFIENGTRYVWFYCPGCLTHHRIIDGRWTWNQSETTPTFSPSVKVTGTVPLTAAEVDRVMAGVHVEPSPLVCHSFVRDGRIQFLADSTHALAGKTVDLPNIEESF